MECEAGAGGSAGKFSSGFKCDDGYYYAVDFTRRREALAYGHCEPCSPVENSNNVSLTCSSATNTQGDYAQGFRCNTGFYRVAGTPDKCMRTLCANLTSVSFFPLLRLAFRVAPFRDSSLFERGVIGHSKQTTNRG